jgi:hypothetical protein
MSKLTPERIALRCHIEDILRTLPLTEGDYDASGTPTPEAADRFGPQILPHLSEAERQELAAAHFEEIFEEAASGLVAEGTFERFSDELGNTFFRLRPAN